MPSWFASNQLSEKPNWTRVDSFLRSPGLAHRDPDRAPAPRSLTLLESAFNGHYIFHSVVPRDAASPLEAYEHRLVDVNRHGMMLDSPGRSLPPELDDHFP